MPSPLDELRRRMGIDAPPEPPAPETPAPSPGKSAAGTPPAETRQQLLGRRFEAALRGLEEREKHMNTLARAGSDPQGLEKLRALMRRCGR